LDARKCKGLVGTPCKDGTCHEDRLYCKLFEGEDAGFCECQDGFVENEERKCALKFGLKCEKQRDCDPITPLACIDKICQCKNRFYKYWDGLRKCVALIVASCSSENPCTEDAECRKHILPAKCVCKHHFHVNSKFECELTRFDDIFDLDNLRKKT